MLERGSKRFQCTDDGNENDVDGQRRRRCQCIFPIALLLFAPPHPLVPHALTHKRHTTGLTFRAARRETWPRAWSIAGLRKVPKRNVWKKKEKVSRIFLKQCCKSELLFFVEFFFSFRSDHQAIVFNSFFPRRLSRVLLFL